MKRKFLVAGLAAALAVGGLVAGWRYWSGRTSDSAPVTQPAPPPTPQPVSLTGRYLFSGTVFWGRRIQQWSTRADGTIDYTYPFTQLATFSSREYDEWIADLECPTSVTDVPVTRQENELVFNCRPEFLPEAAKNFTIFNLSNNHSDNLGPEGLEETRTKLHEAGIQVYGHYEPGNTAEACEVIGLAVRVRHDDQTETSETLPVAFCAWHYFYRLPLPGELEVMRAYAERMPVFAFAHMGVEYRASADAIQRQIAHAIVDRGPEFLIANNPHWVQDAEVYKEKLIVYSTGNFMFDQQYNAEVTRSVSIEAEMSLAYDDNVARWLKLGKECIKLRDNCLSRATEQGLTKPKLSFTFELIAGDNTNQLTKRADPAVQQAVEERLRWAEVKAALPRQAAAEPVQ